MNKKIAAIFIFGLFFPALVLAQSPVIVFFTASPTNINSGYPVSFSWNLQNAGGYSFYYLCSTGVKFKIPGGANLNCDTKVSSTSKVNDYLVYEIYNISGGTKNVTARLVPKNSSSQDYEGAASDVILAVAPVAQPLTNFSADLAITSPGKSVTINWTSQIIEGVNLMIDCQNDVRIFSPSYGTGSLPCGELAFASDLAPSGSLVLNFTNSSRQNVPIKLTLLPAISPKSYDGTHAAYLNLTIASDILPDPEVTFFTASSSVVNSGDSILFKWGVDKAVGANMQISCGSYVAVATSSEEGAVALPCDIPFFSTPLATSSSINLFFKNQDTTLRTVVLFLMPSKKLGEYDLTRAKSIAITIRLPAQPLASNVAVVFPVTPATSTAPIITPKLSTTAKFLFTGILRKGSKGAQVTALQEFLKKDSLIYPEGIVSGYFGPATERAIQRFQKKYGIVSSGSSNTTGFGMVGPKTRIKLNELQ